MPWKRLVGIMRTLRRIMIWWRNIILWQLNWVMSLLCSILGCIINLLRRIIIWWRSIILWLLSLVMQVPWTILSELYLILSYMCCWVDANLTMISLLQSWFHCEESSQWIIISIRSILLRSMMFGWSVRYVTRMIVWVWLLTIVCI